MGGGTEAGAGAGTWMVAWWHGCRWHQSIGRPDSSLSKPSPLVHTFLLFFLSTLQILTVVEMVESQERGVGVGVGVGVFGVDKAIL